MIWVKKPAENGENARVIKKNASPRHISGLTSASDVITYANCTCVENNLGRFLSQIAEAKRFLWLRT
jgi:hypothetical protein